MLHILDAIFDGGFYRYEYLSVDINLIKFTVNWVGPLNHFNKASKVLYIIVGDFAIQTKTRKYKISMNLLPKHRIRFRVTLNRNPHWCISVTGNLFFFGSNNKPKSASLVPFLSSPGYRKEIGRGARKLWYRKG